MAAYSGHYLTQKLVENRLSAAVVRRIYDDAGTGSVSFDTDTPGALLIADAESMFEGWCRGIYDLVALRTAKPPEAQRLCLDIAFMLAAKRFPKAMMREWQPLEQSVLAELKALRKGDTRFDVVGAPEPAANQGGYTSSGDPDNQTPVPPAVFLNNWGSF